MFHSVTFGNWNSYDDWHLVPDSRPVIVMPSVKTSVVEVPGGNGVIDLSEALTKYPLYNTRQGSLKFHVLNDYRPWSELYMDISNKLHGKKITLTLEDDPDWYYEGRCDNVTWTSNNDGTWSDIEISYILDPFKYYREVYSFTETLSSGTSNKSTSGLFSNELSYPVVPEINVTSNGTSGLSVYVLNSELGLTSSNNITKIGTTGKRKLYGSLLSNLDKKATGCTFVCAHTSGTSGSATYTVSYRKVAL